MVKDLTRQRNICLSSVLYRRKMRGVILSRSVVEAKNLVEQRMVHEILQPEFILSKDEGASVMTNPQNHYDKTLTLCAFTIRQELTRRE